MYNALLIIALHFILISTVAHIWLLWAKGETWEKVARWSTVGGCATLTIGLVALHLTREARLFSSSSDLFVFLALCTVGLYLIFYNRFQSRTLGAMAMPLAAVHLTLGLLSTGSQVVVEERSTAFAVWTTVHVASAALGAGLFSIAAIASGLYALEDLRLKRRLPVDRRLLPPLATLDRINRMGLSWGYVLFSLGLAMGIIKIFALKHEDGFHDPLVGVFLLSWVLYSALILARSVGSIGARRAALGSIVCFGIALSGFMGARIIRSSVNGGMFFHGPGANPEEAGGNTR